MSNGKISFERTISSKLRYGFYTQLLDEDIGQITDIELLTNIPTRQLSFVRIVDEVVQNGVYLRKENGNHNASFLDMLFRAEQTGLLADKEVFFKPPLVRGDRIKLTLNPLGNRRIMIGMEILP